METRLLSRWICVLALGVSAWSVGESQAQGCLYDVSANGNFEFGQSPNSYSLRAAPLGAWYSQSGVIELWGNGWSGVPAAEGSNFIELNANGADVVYQDVPTVVGESYRCMVAHRGRTGVNTAFLELVDPPMQTAMVTDRFSWAYYSLDFVATQPMTRVRLVSGNAGSVANFLDDFSVNLIDSDCDGYTVFQGDCDDSNAGVNPEGIEVCDGIDNNCDGSIDETDLSLTADACVASYYGYAPMDGTTLGATVSGGQEPYSYLWSTGDQTEAIFVAPGSDSQYGLTVTDSYGCSASVDIEVRVIDLRCGKNNNKVAICHVPPGNPAKARSLCISANSVADHLAHGCYLGSCDAGNPCDQLIQANRIGHDAVANSQPFELSEEQSAEYLFYPNPARDELQIRFAEETFSGEPRIVRIMALSGQIVLETKTHQAYATIGLHDLPAGVYFVCVIAEGKRLQTEKLILVR